MISQHPVALIPMGHGIKGRTAASWFLGPDGCLSGNYAISQRAWILVIFVSRQLMIIIGYDILAVTGHFTTQVIYLITLGIPMLNEKRLFYMERLHSVVK